MLFIAGGQLDPNLDRLVHACERMGIEHRVCLHGPDSCPAFRWRSSDNQAEIDGAVCKPSCAFVRYDVFEGLQDGRPSVAHKAMAWYQAIHGWLAANREVNLLNRHQQALTADKLAMLQLAQQVGLKIPHTIVSNVESEIKESSSGGCVSKPLAGGDYCYELSTILPRIEFRGGVAACPAFIQPKLVQPEIRVYYVGSQAMAFGMKSPSLDYRVNQDAVVEPLAAVPVECLRVRDLMEVVGLNFGAADFKTDSATGELCFLELNTSPMFAQFDLQSHGRLCEVIIEELRIDSKIDDCCSINTV